MAPSGWRRLAEVAALGSRFYRAFGHLRARGPEDGPPVLVVPGFIASDRTTLELRRALAAEGFRVHPWRQGMNFGARADTLDRLKRSLEAVQAKEPVVLVGWSLGGLFARALARAMPERVHALVTIGSPLTGDLRQHTNVWRLYERIAGHPVDRPPLPNIEDKPPVPTLALWSRRDGIVGPGAARGTPAICDQCVEVDSSHMGFAVSRRGTAAAAREIALFVRGLPPRA